MSIEIGPITFELGSIELIFIVLVVATALAYLARAIRVAEPILFVLGGVVLGLVLGIAPELPRFALDPDLVFLLFLPPILFAAAYFTPIRDLRANRRPILLLAVGLVLFTTVVVGVVAHTLTGMSWAVAFTLGAIVAPPDAVAATAVLRRLGVGRRIVTVLEGESLFNDATSLIAYRAGIVVVTTGVFSLADATVGFVVVGLGGIGVGIIVGAIVTRALFKTADPTLEIVVTLLAPISAYLAAESLGMSGVLATVTAGLITGRRAARVLSPQARLLGVGAWTTVIFFIHAFVFMLIGLQLPSIVEGLSQYSTGELLWFGVAISLAVIVTRFVWVFPAAYVPRWLSANLRARDPYPPARDIVVVGWAGMRGVVSLAAALALPLTPEPFPERPLILYLTFCVIVATLVGQGLTLPWLVRRLGIVAPDGPTEEEVHARLAAIEAGLRRLDELAEEYPTHLPLIEQLRSEFDHEASHVLPHADTPIDESAQEQLDHRRIRESLVAAQREAVIALRDQGVIDDQSLRRIERDLDLEALRVAS